MVVSQQTEEFLSQWGIVHRALALQASDIIFCVGTPPSARVHGEVVRLDAHILSEEHLQNLIRLFTDAPIQERFAIGDVDYTLEFPALQRRFRVNLFRQHRGLSIVMRVLPQRVQSLSKLGVPPTFERVLQEPAGLVIVGGATGSGKSTTLASVIENINETKGRHIITIEQPIEIVFEEKRSIVEQREVGTHVQDFALALRSALRQSPDVILVGEVRDRETADMVLKAAQVGVLVFATLHTRSARESVSRFISLFEDAIQSGIGAQLAECLRCVLCQKLVPLRAGKGQALAGEVMWCTNGVRHLIRDDKLHLLHSLMEIASKDGMVTMEQSLLQLWRDEKISIDSAYDYANDKLALLSQVPPDIQKELLSQVEVEVETKRLEQVRETQKRLISTRVV
ncbi:MAG: PilT/PilU family type 4a pilus ATPase [Candidatus Eremiobacteraeota bacterium]|nr:PilT/PilU family type 4a pilus ATPase [Candidatus Eremiobacteraeota bacterium]MCW5871227.1 PilT/PilU family type 4a pilus ATPase [Candidatus Eremiobacteraeota bacterium]